MTERFAFALLRSYLVLCGALLAGVLAYAVVSGAGWLARTLHW